MWLLITVTCLKFIGDEVSFSNCVFFLFDPHYDVFSIVVYIRIVLLFVLCVTYVRDQLI